MIHSASLVIFYGFPITGFKKKVYQYILKFQEFSTDSAVLFEE